MSKSSNPLSTNPERREAERRDLLRVLAHAHRLMDLHDYPQALSTATDPHRDRSNTHDRT